MAWQSDGQTKWMVLAWPHDVVRCQEGKREETKTNRLSLPHRLRRSIIMQIKIRLVTYLLIRREILFTNSPTIDPY